ncbi:MAG TPA: hypothetical protein VK540_17565 [Polyangiaceae bacterium]|nr:hypothetical protein [Polyangiaceae bacterium]
MSPSTLTIVTRVRAADGPGGAGRLRAALAVVKDSAAHPSSLVHALPFHRVRGLHFARFTIVEEGETKPTFGPKKYLPAELVLSLVFDGTKVECVEQFIGAARRELDIIYASCEAYPGPKAETAQVRDYLFAHDVLPFVFYQGIEGATVTAVESTAALRDRLRAQLDARLMHGTAETAASLSHDLRPRPPIIAARDLPPALPVLSERALQLRVLAWILVVVSPFVVLALLTGMAAWKIGASEGGSVAVGFAPVALLLALLLLHEAADARALQREEPKSVAQRDFSRVRIVEDVAVQNALSHCVVVKSGVRRIALRIVFWAIRQRVSIVDRYARSLGGIASIHFARWVPLDGGNRLLFLSDYDGSYESYLAEFVDRASAGLSSIWSNTLGFPETWLLVFKGAKDEARFKKWTRDKQLETPIWYSAYPARTVANIHNDLRMSQLLATDQATPDDSAWLGLL